MGRQNRIRIISGKYRSRTISAPGYLPVRPTTDFAREALFNILTNRFDLSQCEALDLYCGIGGITMEFLSRGAPTVDAVDKNPKCVYFVEQTAEKLGAEGLKVYRAGVNTFIGFCKSTYDIIFADPPFEKESTLLLPGLLFEQGLLKENGLLIVEHSKRQDLSGAAGFQEIRKYGSVRFSLFGCPE